MKHLSWDGRCADRDLNWVPPEYKAGELTARPGRSVNSVSTRILENGRKFL
jgi:hypothetical protein